ncbi:hypothetical protein [Streptomyces sp. NPDC001135]
MQTSVAAAGLDMVPAVCLLLGGGWAVGMAALGMAAFAIRTRSHQSCTAARAASTGVERAASVP